MAARVTLSLMCRGETPREADSMAKDLSTGLRRRAVLHARLDTRVNCCFEEEEEEGGGGGGGGELVEVKEVHNALGQDAEAEEEEGGGIEPKGLELAAIGPKCYDEDSDEGKQHVCQHNLSDMRRKWRGGGEGERGRGGEEGECTVLMPPLPSSLENCFECAAGQHAPVALAASSESAVAIEAEHCKHAGRRVEKTGRAAGGAEELEEVMEGIRPRN